MFSRIPLFVVPLASATFLGLLPVHASEAGPAPVLDAPAPAAQRFTEPDATTNIVAPYDLYGGVNLQSTASSEGVYGFFKGDKEFTLTGAGTAADDFDTNSFGFGSQLGYFFEDNMEVSARVNGALSSGESSYQLGVGAAFDYHFRLMDGRLNPFVGVVVGYNFGDDVNDSFAAGPEVGVKYFVNETTFLFGNVSYQWAFRDGGGSDAADEGLFAYGIGIGFKF